jgi:hypothetical protein
VHFTSIMGNKTDHRQRLIEFCKYLTPSWGL